MVAYDPIHAHLYARELTPGLQRLDNEASVALQLSMQNKNIDFQLVPPHNHRRKTTECYIITFDNHFIAGIGSAHTNLHLNQWDTLLPQAKLILNLLQPSRINLKLSGYNIFNGDFKYNRITLAPPRRGVIVHKKPDKRASWAPHGTHGWYIGPSLLHYRCYKCYFPSTNSQRDLVTVEFFPHKFPILRASPVDAVIKTALDFITALQNPSPASLFDVSNPSLCALHKLAEIFHTTTLKYTINPFSSSV